MHSYFTRTTENALAMHDIFFLQKEGVGWVGDGVMSQSNWLRPSRKCLSLVDLEAASSCWSLSCHRFPSLVPLRHLQVISPQIHNVVLHQRGPIMMQILYLSLLLSNL